MYFDKAVSITNIEDLRKELREDCYFLLEDIKYYNILEELLTYFAEDRHFDCEDIYEYFIYEVDEFTDIVEELYKFGRLTKDKYKRIKEDLEKETED